MWKASVRLTISVDEDKCCGAGTCVMTAPELFDQRDEDGVVVLLDAAPGEELRAPAREAADMCPAQAILLSESS